MSEYLRNAFDEAQRTLDTFVGDANNLTIMHRAIENIGTCLKSGGSIYSCGNGGSMCDAMHFAEELTGKFRDAREPIPAMAISDPGHLSCVANDFGYEQVFSRFLSAWGKKGDILLAISTSGNSKNIINAVKVAGEKGITTIGLLGRDGGQLKSLVNYPIIVEAKHSDRIQEIHIKIIHLFIDGIEKQLNN